MNNPYAVLGLSPDCTDKQLKKAMRQLSKRWHPDMNPGQEAFAQRKFREVQEAYEQILRERATGTGRTGTARAERSNTYTAGSDPRYYRRQRTEEALFRPFKGVEQLIENGMKEEALRYLGAMPEPYYDSAVWNYYMARVYKDDNIDLAKEYIGRAIEYDPNIRSFWDLSREIMFADSNRSGWVRSAGRWKKNLKTAGEDLGLWVICVIVMTIIFYVVAEEKNGTAVFPLVLLSGAIAGTGVFRYIKKKQ